jgi:hypothetical protein
MEGIPNELSNQDCEGANQSYSTSDKTQQIYNQTDGPDNTKNLMPYIKVINGGSPLRKSSLSLF